jgi:hypothetical protein
MTVRRSAVVKRGKDGKSQNESRNSRRRRKSQKTTGGDRSVACMSTCLRRLGLVRVHTMWGRTLPRLAAVMAVGWLAGACSSDKLRDQNYGTDLAQGYRYPDGGYPTDTRDAGDAGDADDAVDLGDAADAGAGADTDAPDAGAGG